MRYLLIACSFAGLVVSNSALSKDKILCELPVARSGEVIDSIGSGAIPPVLPIVQMEDGISYITGGVGDEELAFLKEQEACFNTRILLKEKNGDYIGNAEAVFTDAKGEVVLTVDGAGPYLYANMPKDIYKVKFTRHNGKEKEAKIKVGDKPKMYYIVLE